MICTLLEQLQPDLNTPPRGEIEIALLKTLRAELLRRTFRAVEQQKQECQEFKAAIAG
jgi:hypothetical protein